MTRLLIAAVSAIAAFSALVLWHNSRGLTTAQISDVTQSATFRVRAPVSPFRNGARYVRVNGRLDGTASLEIVSGQGRDRTVEAIAGNLDGLEFGGPEVWVDDLVVRYLPGTAKTGRLDLTLACGRSLP